MFYKACHCSTLFPYQYVQIISFLNKIKNFKKILIFTWFYINQCHQSRRLVHHYYCCNPHHQNFCHYPHCFYNNYHYTCYLHFQSQMISHHLSQLQNSLIAIFLECPISSNSQSNIPKVPRVFFETR